MPSSISNSRFGSGVGRFCLGVAWRLVLLLAGYSLFLWAVRPQIITVGLGTRELNRLTAERFLYRGTPGEPRLVVVGSSMARTLDSGLPRGCFGLCFLASNGVTGLEMVRRDGCRPRAVVVELNALQQPPDPAVVEEAFAEPGYSLRRWIPALRLEHRPLFLVKTWARDVGMFLSSGRFLPDPREDDVERPTPYLEKGVGYAVAQADAAGEPERATVLRNLDALAAQVAALEREGVRVFFLYLPCDPRVEERPFRRWIHDEARLRFPEGERPWIEFPSDGTYRTIDGVHLTVHSARLIAARVVEQTEAEMAKEGP